jgi:hypothetical protein
MGCFPNRYILKSLDYQVKLGPYRYFAVMTGIELCKVFWAWNGPEFQICGSGRVQCAAFRPPAQRLKEFDQEIIMTARASDTACREKK